MDQYKEVTIVKSNKPTTNDDVLKSSEFELWMKAHGIRNGFYVYKSSLELDRSWYICFVETIKEFDF